MGQTSTETGSRVRKKTEEPSPTSNTAAQPPDEPQAAVSKALPGSVTNHRGLRMNCECKLERGTPEWGTLEWEDTGVGDQMTLQKHSPGRAAPSARVGGRQPHHCQGLGSHRQQKERTALLLSISGPGSSTQSFQEQSCQLKGTFGTHLNQRASVVCLSH